MSPSEPFALYVHFPWCRRVCPYCDFNVVAGLPPADAYVEALTTELAAHLVQAPWAGRAAATVYLGGGTPSLFSPDSVAELLDAVRHGPGLADDAEITLEANPGTVSRERLAAYLAAGVNRLSLGAQSFHPQHLRTLGRDHAAEETAEAVAAAQAAGFANLSLDLIFGVPGATPTEWERDLAAAVALAPQHVSAYGLTYEEGTPFHSWRAGGRLHPVDEDTEAVMADAAATRLGAAGYERYEISSWARPGFASRHNQSYWDGRDYLGLGAGAHSFSAAPSPGRRWVNERRPEAYRAAVLATGRAVAHEERLSAAEAEADFMIAGLRRMAGVEPARFSARFGRALEAAFPQVEGLLREGLLERAGARLRLTPRGLAFADSVAGAFV